MAGEKVKGNVIISADSSPTEEWVWHNTHQPLGWQQGLELETA
jgi:hypothetical protein